MKFIFRLLAALPLLAAALLAQPGPVAPPVNQIVAGTNITISPTNGRGTVTINATGGTSGSGTAGQVAFWDGTTSLTGDTDLTFSGSTLTFTNGIAPTSLLVGTSTMPSLNGSASAFTLVDTAGTLPRGISNVQYSTDANSANFSGYKARGSQAIPSIVAASDVLTNIRVWGYDGSNTTTGFLNMGSIRFRVPSGTTPAATSVPTEAIISVGSNATPSVLTDTITASSTTGIALTALGTNQSITLTPSGTGGVTLTGSGSATLGILRLPSGTTAAQGIAFGTDVFLYRYTTRGLAFDTDSGDFILRFRTGGTERGYILNSGTTMAFNSGGPLQLNSSSITALTLDASQNATFAKKITSYNGFSTAGNGVATIQGAGTVTAQVAAASSIATYSVGAADADFIVSGQVTVTASTTHSFSMECAYTDAATNTARTLTFNTSQLNGTLGTLITAAIGVGPYEGVPLHLRAKASTSITIRTNSGGTYTSVTYDASGAITKLQ